MTNMDTQDEFYPDPEERAQLEKQWKEEKERQERHDKLWSNFDTAKENPDFRAWLDKQENKVYPHLQSERNSQSEMDLPAPIQNLVDNLVEDFDLPGKLKRMGEICEKYGIRAVKPMLDSVHRTVSELLVTHSTEYKKERMEEEFEASMYEGIVNSTAMRIVGDIYGCYVANSVDELPMNPYEEYQRFNEFARHSEERDSDFQGYLCEWEEHYALDKITEIKKADAERYIQRNLSCSLDEYEAQMERQKRPEQWEKFDAARKYNLNFEAWINKQKEDVAGEIILSRRHFAYGPDHGDSLTGPEAERLSRKVEAYAFYVQSACGGNTFLNPYAEHKRFTEFRNNPEYNTDYSLDDKHMLDRIAGVKGMQARAYIREKFSCDLEEYEQKKQKNVNKDVKKDVGLEF